MTTGASGSTSKKRSGASSKSKPLEPLVFFIDRSLGKKRIADALREAGVEVRVHDEHFAADARDIDWLAAVGRQGWVVLTKDKGIRWRALECAAVMDARVRQFTLTAGNLDAAAMARAFVRALPAMRRFLARYERAFIAKVDRSGRVQMLLTEAQWKRRRPVL